MFAISRILIAMDWMNAPDQPKPIKIKDPIDPIANLTNRSYWAINSIKGAVENLHSINTEIQQEVDNREILKNQLIQEQATLMGVSRNSEVLISKVAAVFASETKQDV